VGTKSFGLPREDAQDKDDWRLRIKRSTSQVEPTLVEQNMATKMVCVNQHYAVMYKSYPRTQLTPILPLTLQ